GVQWVKPGETIPAQPGQLLVFESFQEAIVVPEGCGCILIDPGFAAVAPLLSADVYEGRSEDYAVLSKQLVKALEDPGPGVGASLWGLEPSPHVLSVLNHLSKSRVWSDVESRLKDEVSSSKWSGGSAVDREKKVRTFVFDALDPVLRDCVG